MTETYTNEQIADVFWDYLKKDPEHKDRRKTAWGTKTKTGIALTVKALSAEWVSMAEAAPPLCIKYLVAVKPKSGGQEYTSFALWDNGSWVFFSPDQRGDVTHWRNIPPLPTR